MFTQRTKLFILRDIIVQLMIETHENETIYVFSKIDNFEIIYLYDKPVCEFLKREVCECYKTTLKKLYLYLLTKDYPNAPIECLIIFANRTLRNLTIEQTAKLISISKSEYQSIETGKVVNFDLEKIAKMLNFKREEFYYNFKTAFEKIVI